MARQYVVLSACMLFAVCSIAASQQQTDPLPPSVSAVLSSEDNPFLADEPPPPIPSNVISAPAQQPIQTDGIEQQQPEAEQGGDEAIAATTAPPTPPTPEVEQGGEEAPAAATTAPPTLPTPAEPASSEDPCGCSTTGPGGNSTFAGCGQWLASQGSNAFVCYVNDPSTCPEAITLEPSSIFPGQATKSCTAEQAVMEGTLPTLEQLLSTLVPQASEFYALSSFTTPAIPPPRGDKTILVPSNEALNAAYRSGQLSKSMLQENPEEAARLVASHTLPSGSIQAQSLGALGEVRTSAGNTLQTSIGAATGRFFVDGVVVLVPDLLATDGILHIIGGVLPVNAADGELVVASPPVVPPSTEIPLEQQVPVQEQPVRAETLPPPPSIELPEAITVPPIAMPPGMFPPAMEVIPILQTELPRQQTDHEVGAIPEDQGITAPVLEVEGTPPIPEPATVYSDGRQEEEQQEPQDVQGSDFAAPAPETEESPAIVVETPQLSTEFAQGESMAPQTSSSSIGDAQIVVPPRRSRPPPPPQSIAAISQQQQQTANVEPRRPSIVIDNGVVDLNSQGDNDREMRPSSLNDVFASISRQAQRPSGQRQTENAFTMTQIPDSVGRSRSSASSSLPSAPTPVGLASSVPVTSETTSGLSSSRGGFGNCECSTDGVSGGVRTGMRGCERRLGEQFRLLPFPFCYVDPSCPLSTESADFPGAAYKIC